MKTWNKNTSRTNCVKCSCLFFLDMRGKKVEAEEDEIMQKINITVEKEKKKEVKPDKKVSKVQKSKEDKKPTKDKTHKPTGKPHLISLFFCEKFNLHF